MFFGLDPLYFMMILPGVALGLWAQMRVKSTFSKYANVGTKRGLRGVDVADAILQAERVQGVRIEESSGWLSDHYSPQERALRLSPDVYHGRSIAAAGVAAHEVGHAVQHAHGYAPLGMRSTLVPVVQFAAPLGVPMLMAGFFMSMFVGSSIGRLVSLAGVALFSVTVVFQILTLPVEIDASRRALAAIRKGGFLTPVETKGAGTVLRAAAWTYVAAAVSSLLTLLYYMIRLGILGGNREE
ncbi:MAG: zinc metallopeptidase [Myxococcota bacterium]